jgi:hypothetical protein
MSSAVTPRPAAREDSPARAFSPGEAPQRSTLSPWLQLMLAEIARKRCELEAARAEQTRRDAETGALG